MTIRTRAWTALALPPISWFLFQQGLSILLRADCRGTGWGIAWGLASLAVCALAMRLAWRLGRHEGALGDPWLARLAKVLGALFALAITFQMLAIAVVPPCLG